MLGWTFRRHFTWASLGLHKAARYSPRMKFPLVSHRSARGVGAVFHDKLLTPASRAKLLTPAQDNYALGVSS